jgi:hypothetical protein
MQRDPLSTCSPEYDLLLPAPQPESYTLLSCMAHQEAQSYSSGFVAFSFKFSLRQMNFSVAIFGQIYKIGKKKRNDKPSPG